MIEQPRDLGSLACLNQLFLEQLRRRRDLSFIVRRAERLARPGAGALLLNEIVNETNAMTFGDRLHLVFAICIERSKADLRNLRAMIQPFSSSLPTSNWRNAAGQIKDMAARTLLLKLSIIRSRAHLLAAPATPHSEKYPAIFVDLYVGLHISDLVMRPSTCKSTVTVTRLVAGITMQQLSEILGCSRMSLQQIELGRLKLSRKMAEKISLHTGVSMNWLLANHHQVRPVSQRDDKEPFTREVYLQARAEILKPRTDPMDVRFLENSLAAAYHELNAAAEEAYRSDQIIYFYYQLREFLETLAERWPATSKLQPSMNVAQTAEVFRKRFEKHRRALERAHPKD
jgi:transcriptional regulator with XRE-family HTH domain